MDRESDQLDAPDLAAALARLPIKRRAALGQAVRRRILRRLQEREDPQALVDLATHEGMALSCTNYHARVLSSCGLIGSVATRQVRGNVQSCFVSTVREDPDVCSLLAVAEASDSRL